LFSYLTEPQSLIIFAAYLTNQIKISNNQQPVPSNQYPELLNSNAASEINI